MSLAHTPGRLGRSVAIGRQLTKCKARVFVREIAGSGPELFPSTPDPEWIDSRDITLQGLLPCFAAIGLWAATKSL
jgi:hypothetical protein